MNCQQIRNRILAEELPSQLPERLATHLGECSACHAWYANFILVDRALTRLPVPESLGMLKSAVLEEIRTVRGPKKNPRPSKPAIEILNGKSAPHLEPLPLPTPVPDLEPLPAPAPPARVSPIPEPVSKLDLAPIVQMNPKPSALNLEDDLPKRKWSVGQHAAKFWPAGLVAATLLLGTIAWFSLRPDKPVAPTPMPDDPFLDSIVKLNVELATSQTAVDRVKIFARVADELNQEMRDIARADATGENMQALEEMYRKVVLKGLVDQAKLVDRAQREVVLSKIADRLTQAGQKAEHTATESPEHSASALRDAAGTAKEGTKQIRRLIQEAYS